MNSLIKNSYPGGKATMPPLGIGYQQHSEGPSVIDSKGEFEHSDDEQGMGDIQLQIDINSMASR